MKSAPPPAGKGALAIQTGKTVPNIPHRPELVRFLRPDGTRVAVSGKRARILHALIEAGPKGVSVHDGWPTTTAFTQHVSALRHSHGLDVVTDLDPNAERTDTHARYRLITPIVPVTDNVAVR